MNKAAITIAQIGFGAVLFGMLFNLIFTEFFGPDRSTEAPAPDRIESHTVDHHPPTIRHLIGPSGFEVWEFRTPTGTRCMLAQSADWQESARALSCEWRPSPDY